MLFSAFPLSKPVLDGIAAMGFDQPLPIQERAIPAVLEGRDVVGCSQTGTGKTAAYLVPILEGLLAARFTRRFRPRALVLTPTRELAQQVGEHFSRLAARTKVRHAVVHGGTEIGSEERAFNEGVDLLIATPGRLLDHLERGGLKLTDLAYLVIDEADRLFDAGFLPDLRRLMDRMPERRQTLLFSATMPPEMEQFAHAILRDPERIQIGLVAPRDQIRESFWPVPDHQKLALLKGILAAEPGLEKVMVFVRTRAKARNHAPELEAMTGLRTAELHSELTQTQRDETMHGFRQGEIQMLVATDVAARGLDFADVSHVINFDVPNTPDDYIHRVGRTGRVDRAGVAITLVCPKELTLAASIESTVRRRIPYERLLGFPYEIEEAEGEASAKDPRQNRGTSARPFTERPMTGKKKESPFTRSGHLKKQFQDKDFEGGERRKSRQRAEKKIVNKRLPHQRKHK